MPTGRRASLAHDVASRLAESNSLIVPRTSARSVNDLFNTDADELLHHC